MEELLKELSIGTQSRLVENPFTGRSTKLNPKELALYDYLRGAEIVGDFKYSGMIKDYFLDNNPNAYMILID